MKKWVMFRIWIPTNEQKDFVMTLVKNKPTFPFSFNRYTEVNITKDEKPHIQFRFPEENQKDAEQLLKNLTTKETTLCDWDGHINTIKTAEVASKCALHFMELMGAYTRPNPLVMAEFLHFFLDDLGHSYYDEALLHQSCADFFRQRRKIREEWSKE